MKTNAPHRTGRTTGSVVRGPRLAFTLLETMLSLTLAAMLLAAIYAAIDQSWRLSSSGREEMERAQLARALIHRIQLDIRAITYVPPPPVEEDPVATPTTGTTPTTATSDTEPPVPNSKSVGIRGTTQQMEMSIARPQRDLLPGSSPNGLLLSTSDLRSVTYSFLPAGSSSMSGLVRMEGDRMAVEVVEAGGSSASQISSMQMLAPEVSSLYFRYFDGRIWSEMWDSDTMARIPRAVEVSISFPPPRRKPAVFGGGASQSMNLFRTVIVIPVSDPYPKDFAP